MTPMGIGVSCSCGFNTSVPEQFAGQKVVCPQCDKFIDIPGSRTEGPPEATRRLSAEEAVSPKPMHPETERRLRQIADTARVAEAERTAAQAFWLGLIGLIPICLAIPSSLAVVFGIRANQHLARAGRRSLPAMLGVGIGIVGIVECAALLALLVTGNLRLVSVAREQVRVQHCKDNLEAIYRHVSHYRERHGSLPSEKGRDLLRKIVDDKDALICPVAGKPYRGPRGEGDKLRSDQDVVACDDPNGHPDGAIHVLTMSGEVRLVRKNEAGYRTVLDNTE